MVAPVKNPIVTCPFKYRSQRKPSPWAAGYHPGIDYKAAIGTPTYAPTDGKIINTTYDGSYGYKIVIESVVGGKKVHVYVCHHKKGGVLVKRGQNVKAGDRIGSSGDTGNTFGPHVHLEVREAPFGYYDHIDPKVVVNVKAGKASTDKMDPAAYFLGAHGPHVTWLGERLVAHGFGKHYQVGPGPTFGESDRLNVRDVQLFLGFRGGDADGFPGKSTLAFLAADPDPDLPPDTEGPVLEDPMPFEVLARWAWTDTKDNRNDPLDPAKVNAITVHYPADGDVTYADLTQQQVAANLERYRRFHVENKGWRDIGYNYAIDGQGRIWFLTGDDIGAHANTVGNTTSIGVLFVIGNNEQPTARMVEAFKVLRAEKLAKYPKATKVQGHQQVPGNQTACPGAPLMAAIRSGVLTEAPLPAPEPEPEPEPEPPVEPPPPTATDTRFRLLVINVGADYVPGYNARIDDIEDVRNDARASVVVTTESGSYADAEKLNKWFGWGGKRNGTVATGESFVLHGGSVPITTAVHFNPRDCDVLDEGLWVTVPGTTHRWATWVLLRDNQTRELFIVVATHLQYLPKGPNTVKKYDQERYRQLDKALELTKALQAKVLKSRPELGVVPAFVAGDMNSTRNDKYDGSVGVSKAAKDNGFADAGVDDKPIIDRVFYTPDGIAVLEHRVVPTNGATDHKTAFTGYFSLTNRRSTTS